MSKIQGKADVKEKETVNKDTTVICMKVLDECAMDFNKKYYAEDILKKCNDRLRDKGYQETGEDNLNKVIRKVRDKLPDDVELKNYRDGRYGYYRYTKEYFSLYDKNLLNPDQVKDLREISNLLKNLVDMEQFDWAVESMLRIEQIAEFKSQANPILMFDQNYDYEGLKHISELYKAINDKKVLTVKYKPGFVNDVVYQIHPYVIRQYNSRWFLYGYDELKGKISNLALDRIEKIEENVEIGYRENRDIDFLNDYFFNVYGATVKDKPVQEIVLECLDEKLLNYIKSKPIHGTQKINGNIITLEIILNYEIVSRLLEYADRMKIVAPIELREKILEIADNIKEVNKMP